MPKRAHVHLFALIMLLLFIDLLAVSYFFKEPLTNFIEGELRVYGLFILFVLALVLELVPQYIAPQLFAFNAAILGLGFWETTLSLYAGCFVGSIIGFELGFKYRGKLSRLLFEEDKIENVKEKINNWGRYAILAAAISPVPYVPILFGSLSLSRKNFFIFGLIPRFFYYLLFSIVAYSIF